MDLRERTIPKPGDKWRRCDGKIFEILKVAQAFGGRDINVIMSYRLPGGKIDFHQETLWDFLNEVDKDNYPETDQEHMFEIISESEN